jgi:hypothetical protein
VGNYRARKEEIKNREGQYWYAYKRIDGKLRKRYLGKSNDLTLERLEAAAYDLENQAKPRTQSPNTIGNKQDLAETVEGMRRNAVERESVVTELLRRNQELKSELAQLKQSLRDAKRYKLHGEAVIRVSEFEDLV